MNFSRKENLHWLVQKPSDTSCLLPFCLLDSGVLQIIFLKGEFIFDLENRIGGKTNKKEEWEYPIQRED